MDKQQSQPRILVAGAGGKLGKQVVELLHAQGYTGLIAASRNPDKLAHLADLGIELRRADFNDPEMLKTAFQNVNRLLLISTDELQTPGLRIRQHINAIEAAKAAGIKHIVYTSMPNPETSGAIPFAHDHVSTEQALIRSGIGYTILRVSWYCENLLGYLPQIIAAKKWATVAGDGKIAFVPRADVARVTAVALLSGTENQILDIAGTEALTILNIAEIVNEVFGFHITVMPTGVDLIQDELQAIGIPAAFVPTVVMTDLNTKAGNFNIASTAIERLTGIAPKPLKEFLRTNASLFIANKNLQIK